MNRTALLLSTAAALGALAPAAPAQTPAFTHADTLRGTNTPERAWWDVAFYDLHVTIDPADSTLMGWNRITYRVTGRPREMQIDLQMPLEVDSMVQDGQPAPSSGGTATHSSSRDGQQHRRSGPPGRSPSTTTASRASRSNPPWDGGLIWARGPDRASLDRAPPARASAPSVWWPNKDTQADEPDSQRVALTVPDSLQAVANGRLRGVERRAATAWTTYEWFVTSPINNYDVAAYVGPLRPDQRHLRGRETGRSRSTSGRSRRHLETARDAVRRR